MTTDPRRRALLRHGFQLMVLALVLGFATIFLPHPTRWRAAHLTALLSGIVLIVMGMVWNELRLTNGQRNVAYRANLLAAYGGFTGAVFGAITNIPGPASDPGVAMPMPQAAVFLTIFVITASSISTAVLLALYGARGTE